MLKSLLMDLDQEASMCRKRTFMMDFDYSADFAVGFDPTVLKNYLKAQKNEGLIEGWDHPS